MTNTNLVEKTLGDGHRCIWQVCPDELPKDMPSFALELHQDDKGGLHLFQMFVPHDRPRDWFSKIEGFAHFKEVGAE